ncbi:MAG: DUF1800 domain-containing protein [Erythrobacter sp.]|uniref:DUF1800 domain-containing protein n=1 Tax=Erythrobacter sp. TaxID=1042 RepID=UPI0025F68B83|nr:DUF1800 domain-containing protein [Erythrobacter sp.]MCL9998712.1 DUF1800 domain-containing protein [Erythrobacter sp.]
MSRPSIALSRFGYGISAKDSPPADPRRYLLAQLDAYDPAPAAIAGRMRSRGETGAMVELVRSLRQDRRLAGAMAEAGPAMAGQSAPSDDPRAAALEGLPPEYRSKLAEARQVLVGDIAARTQLAVSSPAPMIERLVHFWSNHFSVSVGKVGTQFEVGPHEFTAIRPHVLGRFADMLKAAVLHPAMLLYLDQFQSIGPNAPFAQARARRGGDQPERPRGLNENLAREVLELHTLGVDGGYTQADVTELARALTGWTVPGIGRVGRFAEDQPSGAAFVALVHEPGARRVLGRTYPAGEAGQALAILNDLAAHPATARHIASKLARHFAGDTPPPALVARLEADFLKTGGDLASLTATLIDAPEVWTPAPVKFRTPFEWLIGAMRLTSVGKLPPQRIVGALNELGQVPWRAPSPAGYDDLAASWAGPDALVRRVELAERIAGNVPADDVLARAEAAFPGALGEATRTQLSRAESGSQALALLLVSPEMMRR